MKDWIPDLIDCRGGWYVGIYKDGTLERLDAEEAEDFIDNGSRYLEGQVSKDDEKTLRFAGYNPFTVEERQYRERKAI